MLDVQGKSLLHKKLFCLQYPFQTKYCTLDSQPVHSSCLSAAFGTVILIKNDNRIVKVQEKSLHHKKLYFWQSIYLQLKKKVIIFCVHKDGKGFMIQIKLFIIRFEILTKHIYDKHNI